MECLVVVVVFSFSALLALLGGVVQQRALSEPLKARGGYSSSPVVQPIGAALFIRRGALKLPFIGAFADTIGPLDTRRSRAADFTTRYTANG